MRETTGGIVLKEFKEFINKGSLVDVAVAFVIGLAFVAVISSFTEGVVTPLIGKIFSIEGLDTYVIADDVKIGAFIAAFLNFVVVAFVMFLVVRAYNSMKRPIEEAPADTPEDVALLREIRDALKR